MQTAWPRRRGRPLGPDLSQVALRSTFVTHAREQPSLRARSARVMPGLALAWKRLARAWLSELRVATKGKLTTSLPPQGVGSEPH